MKAAHLVCLLVCLLFAAFVHAQEKDDPVKEAQITQRLVRWTVWKIIEGWKRASRRVAAAPYPAYTTFLTLTHIRNN